MRVALVHDYLNQYGGAERVLEAFCQIFPKAPIYTLFYDRKKTGLAFDSRKIRTSFLQKVPFLKSHHRPFLMFMPFAVEQFDLSSYDLVLSDSASYAKGVLTSPQTKHICYCHTPIRYAWDDAQKYIDEFGYPGLVNKFIPFFMNYIRLWDEQAASRVDQFIANSNFVAGRIKKYYHREAVVVHPPVRTDLFYVSEPQDYFLMVGRFLPYKMFDLAIDAFNQLGLPLKIVGSGPEKKRLQKKAKENIEFVGSISDSKLKEYYAHCRAFIFPQEDDFGIVAVEAMASGRPVIAFQGGGALEFVEPGLTGIFFKEQTVDCLVAAIRSFDQYVFCPQFIRASAMRFSQENFKEKIKKIIDDYRN